MNSPPLIVDLDGTLIRTDMLHESALRVLRDQPLRVYFKVSISMLEFSVLDLMNGRNDVTQPIVI